MIFIDKTITFFNVISELIVKYFKDTHFFMP